MNDSPGIIRQRLSTLRDALRRQQAHAFVALTSDPHLSEYLPDHWKIREWLSGFTGSAGVLIVTGDFAGLWTDSRYWEQAESQLADTGIQLQKATPSAIPQWLEWLARNLAPRSVVLTEGDTLPLTLARQIDSQLQTRHIPLNTRNTLVQELWPQRPTLPQEPVYEHPLEYAVGSRVQKLQQLRHTLQEQHADALLISTLDEIAWLLNLRGSDVPYNPVFLSFVILTADQTLLFVDESKIAAPLRAALHTDGVTLRPYEMIGQQLAGLPEGSSLWYDPARTTQGTANRVATGVKRIETPSPITLPKACKNSKQIAHIRDTMAQDGAALCHFFCRFEQQLAQGESLTELDVDRLLGAERTARPGFISLSFATIAGFNGNGAMPHYQATAERHAQLQGNGLLLIDSGAQYMGGTTDITRMVAIGTLNDQQRHDCTLVLKGMIALSSLHFPRGATGPALDSVARAPLWKAGLNYGHGTGHGVGYCLNVHEGPQSISYGAAAEQPPLQPGMITSVEPGLYRPGCWGVRIENLVACCHDSNNEFGEFLRFETLTLCPIDRRCIEPALLTGEETSWLDAYHAEVQRRLAPLLEGDALTWLQRQTRPLAN